MNRYFYNPKNQEIIEAYFDYRDMLSMYSAFPFSKNACGCVDLCTEEGEAFDLDGMDIDEIRKHYQKDDWFDDDENRLINEELPKLEECIKENYTDYGCPYECTSEIMSGGYNYTDIANIYKAHREFAHWLDFDILLYVGDFDSICEARKEVLTNPAFSKFISE